ncbi:MAG TPA: DUF3857 domain-containing protein [Terriglobales bacterium]|nr:DUF3857 domain-containing protein [Terriglobales bacterium]
MGKSKVFLVALCLLLLASISFAGVNIPDWVRQAAAQKLGTYPPDTNAVVLLDQTDYAVTGPGDFVEHSRHVLKLLRPTDRDESKIGVNLGGSDKLQFIHAWTIDSSGHEFEIKQKDFFEAADYPTWILYADDRSIVTKAAAPLPGSVIALEYEVRRHKWINELGWIFQDQIPVLQSIFTVQLPAGWEFRTAWTHGSSVDPVKVGANSWQWTLKDLAGVEEDHEPMMPPFLSLAGRMSFSYFSPEQKSATAASWNDVGKWYSGLTQGRYASNPEISAKVAQLIAGKTDFASRVQALTSFLQSEIRYVEISIGIGGDQPHPAGDVFRYRYGDCKDKVTLLKAMLHEASINSEYVLIDTRRGFVNPDVPSSWSDHAIIAIALPDDVPADTYRSVIKTKSGTRYLIFDPTDEYTPAGLLRPELQNSYALLVTASGGELIKTPLLAPDANTLERIGHFVLTNDGGLSGEVSEDRGGDFAANERHRLHNWDEQKRTNYFERYLGNSLQGFTLESMNVQQADQFQKDVLIQFKFSTPQYAQVRGSLMLVRPRVLGEQSEYVEHKPRHYSIELGEAKKVVDTYEIEIPKSYSVDDVPNAVKIDVGFASYESKIDVEGSKLRYWREYIVRDVSIPADKFSDWVRLQGVIGADETAAVVLKRAP